MKMRKLIVCIALFVFSLSLAACWSPEVGDFAVASGEVRLDYEPNGLYNDYVAGRRYYAGKTEANEIVTVVEVREFLGSEWVKVSAKCGVHWAPSSSFEEFDPLKHK